MSFDEVERRLLRLTFYVGRLVDLAIVLIVAALLVIVTTQFIDRNSITLWYDSPEEYVKIGLVWLCFLGFVRASATGETIRITFAHEMLPKVAQRIVDVGVDLLLLVVVIFLAWKSWVMIQTAQMQIILGTSLTLDVPVYGMFLGFLLMVPMITWRLVRAALGRDPLPNGQPQSEV